MATTNKMTIMVAGAMLWFGLSAAPLMAADDLQRLEHPTLDMLFSSTNTDFAAYERVYLEPISVWYPTARAADTDRVDILRNRAVSELVGAFAANGLEVADAPERDTLIVRVQFIDFTGAPVSEEALAWKRRFRFNVEPGRVTLVAELVDARTGSTVARMADMQDEPASGLSEDLQSALTGWSNIVAAVVAVPSSEVQLASR